MNLYLFEVPLAFPEGVRVVSSMGSVFHGALMEQLPEEVVAPLSSEHLVHAGAGRGLALWRAR